ncbi:MAG TPA: hypothetical protein EYO76_11655 [Flavobacteriaceae bacterium]|nr:hypothetical protein [Flavobacteriaceae bacterium]
MSKLYLTVISILSIIFINQNEVKELNPISEVIPDLSVEAQKNLERFHELYSKKYGDEKVKLTDQENKELEKLHEEYDETTESVWDIIDSGCSWYCGGGNYKIIASSELKSMKTFSYDAKKANDLSYETAWVEGKDGSGIGEYLEYHFKKYSAPVTKIFVSNGYMKTEESWKNNNRVKKLKLYVNNKPFAILNLKDNRSSQEFVFDYNWSKGKQEDNVLRFEILDIYKGNKYNDTAITEIYFDGTGVH